MRTLYAVQDQDFRKYWLENRINVMVVKPYGMPEKDKIIDRIIEKRFLILYEQEKLLTEGQIRDMYADVFQKIIRAYPDSRFISEYIAYMTSSNVLALVTYNDNIGLEQSVLDLRGREPDGDKCQNGTIRKDFRGLGLFNSFHASTNREETYHNLKIIFPSILID